MWAGYFCASGLWSRHAWLNGRALTKQETASTRPHVVQQNVSSNMYKSSVRRRVPIRMCELSQ